MREVRLPTKLCFKRRQFILFRLLNFSQATSQSLHRKTRHLSVPSTPPTTWQVSISTETVQNHFRSYINPTAFKYFKSVLPITPTCLQFAYFRKGATIFFHLTYSADRIRTYTSYTQGAYHYTTLLIPAKPTIAGRNRTSTSKQNTYLNTSQFKLSRRSYTFQYNEFHLQCRKSQNEP